MYRTARTGRARQLARGMEQGADECGAGATVVAPDERIAVLGLQLAVDVLLGLLHRDVHEAVEAREHT